MSLSNFNLRGITPEVMTRLKQDAKKQHTSINTLILKFIEQGVGISPKNRKTRYNDLDSLAGTWSNADAKAFEENTKFFEVIDEELWS